MAPMQYNVEVRDTNGNAVGLFETIQQAIDFASEGYTIEVAAGTYDISTPINITKSLTINAVQADVVLQGSSAAPLFTIASAATNVTISNFRMIGDTVVATGFEGQTLKFSNNVFDITATHDNVFYLGNTGGYDFTFTDNTVNVTGYTEVMDLFEGGNVNIRDNMFNGFAGTYVAGDDNDVPLILNLSDATGDIVGNKFSSVDIGILIANESGPLRIEHNIFSDLHRDAGTTAGGKAAGIVFFSPDYADDIQIVDNMFRDSDVGLRASNVPGTALVSDDIYVARNQFANVTDVALNPIGGTLAVIESNVDGRFARVQYFGGSDADTFVVRFDDDTVDGGANVDTAQYYNPVQISSRDGGWTVREDGGMDRLTNVEIVDDGNGNRTLLVGATGFATIQAAIDEARAGDTIMIAAGTYDENIVINKNGLTFQAQEATLRGNLLSTNNIAEGDLYEYLTTPGNGIGNSSGTGITIAADDITINGLKVTGFYDAALLGDGTERLALNGVDFVSNLNSIRKETTATVSNVTITEGTIADGYVGLLIFKTVTPGDAAVGTFSGVRIDGTDFTDLARKGIYAEALSDALITGITMTNVGQYGAAAGLDGPAGTSGAGINLNLKNGVYSNIEIADFTLTDVGASNGGGSPHANGGAIVITARDDGGTYGPAPARFDGFVDIHDGTISGTLSTGIAVGEPGKTNADPDVTVTDVSITGEQFSSAFGTIANDANGGTLTFDGSAVADELVASGNTDGIVVLNGFEGNDTLTGGKAGDTLNGGADNDVLTGRGGDDTLIGGDGGFDTATYSGTAASYGITATKNAAGYVSGFTAVNGADGNDTLVGIEQVSFSDRTYSIIDRIQLFDANDDYVAGFATIQSAIDAASAGFTIRLRDGYFAENLTLDKAVTILGTNHGRDGASQLRGDESAIAGTITVSAAAVVDGVQIVNASTDGTYFEGVRVHGANDFTVRNSMFFSNGVNGNNGPGGGDRALFLDTTTTGNITFADNLVTGAATGKGGTASWSRGIWSDGSNASLNVDGNTFQYLRSGLNLDGFNSSKVSVSNNLFDTVGTAVAIGTNVTPVISGFTANTFANVDAEFNLRNIGSFTFDAAAAVAGVSGQSTIGAFYAYGGSGNDTLLGTAFDDILDDNAAGSPFDSDTTADTDTLDGRGGNDILVAENGNDTLIGGAGNDMLDGGAGTDTAVFSGNRADYTFGGTTASATVTDGVAARDGTDTLANIELVRFADRTMTLDALVNNVAPTNITLSNDSIIENAANGTVVGNAAATDTNVAGGDTVTYSLENDAGGRFAIDAATGVVTVADGTRLDAEGTPSYQIAITAKDSGGLSATKSFTITIGDADEFDVSTPVDRNDGLDQVSENVAIGTTVGVTAYAADADATTNAVTYSLTNNPGGLFAIDAVTGLVTTAAAIDFEQTGASRSITVLATSADGSTASQTFTIAVLNVNEAPLITSNGGGATATVTVAEETRAVTTVVAGDPDGTALTYTISGGADAARFQIDAVTGALSFRAAPDFEQPGDAGKNNVYDVVVSASDGTLSDTQAIAVAITNVAETQPIVLTNEADTYIAPSNDNYVIDGLAGNDIITTGSGNDVVRGSAGNDTISTGGGNDVITYLGASNGFDTVDGGTGDDEIRALGANAVIGLAGVSNVETITADGNANVKIVGSTAADTLDFAAVSLLGIASIDGGSGNDRIGGSAQADTIIGGAGNDVLAGNGGNDNFVIAASAGFDTVDGGAGYDVIRAGVANAVYGFGGLTDVEEISNVGVTGATFANFRIVAAASDDVMDFSAVKLTGVVSIDGGSGADAITGSAQADTIIGGVGIDTLNGGGGNDVFLVAASAGSDIVDGGAGYDTIRASAANVVISFGTWSSVEAISAGGFAGVKILATAAGDVMDFSGIALDGIVSIDGAAGNDTITGTGAADTIIGGSGVDTLNGAGGNDMFLVAAGAGSDIVDGGAGYDVIRATAANVAIGWGKFTGVEAISGGGFANVTLVGSAAGETIDLSGYELAGIAAIDGGAGNDTITGTDAADTIIGGAGNDVLNGGGGNDAFLLLAGAGVDTIDGGAGYDVIRAGANNLAIAWGAFANVEEISANGFSGVKIAGSTGADVINLTGIVTNGIGSIEGGNGNDAITGTAGTDLILGGAGADMLAGGAGADTFRYLLLTDSRTTGFDTVTDFTHGSDRFDLAAIDANSLVAGDQAFRFLGAGAFGGTAGELRVDTSNAAYIRLIADVDGNRTVDFEIRLQPGTVLDAGDFIL